MLLKVIMFRIRVRVTFGLGLVLVVVQSEIGRVVHLLHVSNWFGFVLKTAACLIFMIIAINLHILDRTWSKMCL